MTRHRFTAAWRPILLSWLILPLLAGQLLASTGQALPPKEHSPKTHIVRHDLGGSIFKRRLELMSRAIAEERIEIRGTCYSACTLYLSLPNTCVSPKATLGFHGIFTKDGKRIGPDRFEAETEAFASAFRPPLRAWYLSTARYVDIQHVLRVKGAELIRLGYKQC